MKVFRNTISAPLVFLSFESPFLLQGAELQRLVHVEDFLQNRSKVFPIPFSGTDKFSIKYIFAAALNRRQVAQNAPALLQLRLHITVLVVDNRLQFTPNNFPISKLHSQVVRRQ